MKNPKKISRAVPCIDIINLGQLHPWQQIGSECDVQDSLWDDNEESDDEDYLPMSTTSGTSTRSDDDDPIRNSKARKISTLAKALVNHFGLLVLENQIYRYHEFQNLYAPVTHPERLVDEFLPPAQADQISRRDCDELVERIRRLQLGRTSPDTLNSAENLINCRSGVLDVLTTPVKCTYPTPEHKFSYCVDANYIPHPSEVACPVFENFCRTSLDDDPAKRLLLLEIIGYICSDSNSGKCAFFLKGAPDSGKSVMSEFIGRLFDRELVASVPLHKLSDRFNKAELFGKKVNIAGEIKAKKLTEITTFKMVTGGDWILAERKGRDPFYFSPRCKLLFSGNALPGTMEADSTAAFSNRLVVLLFNRSISKDSQDKNLLRKLLTERDAIFTLSIYAFQELCGRNFVFTQPSDSSAFLAAFRYSENSVRAFVEDCCISDASAHLFNRDIVTAYSAYCKANGLEERPRQQLYDALDAIPGVRACRFRIGRENCRGRAGLKVAPCDWNSGTFSETS